MAKMFSFSKEKNFLVKVCDAIITTCASLVFLAVPIFFTGLVVQGFIFEKVLLFYLLVLISLVAWVTKGIAQGELKITRTPLDLPILGLGVVLLISSIFSVDTLGSFVGSFGSSAKTFIAFLVYVVFYYIIVNNINDKRTKIFAWSLVSGIILTTVYAALQISEIFVLPFSITQSTSFNPIGSSSSLGVYIISALPILSIFVPALLQNVKGGNLKKTITLVLKVIISLAVLAALFVLFLLNTFVAWPVAIIGMVILLMFILSKIVKIKQSEMVTPIVVFLIFIIFLVGGNFNLVSAQLPAEVGLTRSLSWDIAKESLKRDPLFGSGPSTFDYAFVKYRGPQFNITNLWNVRFDTAQGNAFEILATTGILGAFGFLVMILITISVAFIYLTKSKDEENKTLLLGLFASLVVLIISASFYTVSGTIVILTAIIGAFAMSMIVKGYPEKFKEVKLSFRSSPKYALALSSLFLLVSAGVVILFTSGFKVYLADYFALKAVQSADSEAIEYLNKAIATTNYQDQYYLRLSRLYMNLANQEVQKGNNADIAAIQNYLGLAINAGKRAVDLAPNSVVNKESLALLYENAAGYNINGTLQWAEKYYTDIIAMEPDNPSSYVRLALINMAYAASETSESERNHFYNEAIKFYNQAISKKSDLAAAYYGSAVVYERLNDYEKAIEKLSTAVTLAPSNFDYRFELGRMYFNRGMSQGNINQNQVEDIASSASLNEEGVIDEEELSIDTEETPEPSVQLSASQSENLSTARTIFSNILQVSPNHANAIYSLALIAEVNDNKQAAIDYYERLLDIVQDQATKDAILEKLRSL